MHVGTDGALSGKCPDWCTSQQSNKVTKIVVVLFQVNALIGARYYHKTALVVLFQVNALIGAR